VIYLIGDPDTQGGTVIDAVLDWDDRSGDADAQSADVMLRAIGTNKSPYARCDNPGAMKN